MKERGLQGPVLPFILIGHALFIGLAILAILHWRERVVHVDSAYQIFKWVQKGGVEVEAHRFGAVLPQLMVKLLKAMGASLRTLLITASLGHVLVSYGIFIGLAHVLHRPWIAAASALAAVLCTRLTFYGIVLEANYLLSYPFLLAGLLDRPADAWKRHAGWIAVVLFGVLTVHPVGFLLALFVIALNWLRHQGPVRPYLVLGGVVLAWGAVGRLLFPPSGYEAGLYQAAIEGVSASGPANPALDFLVGHTWRHTTHYMALWGVLLITLITLAMARSWRILALLLIAFSGYNILNIVTYHAGETAMMMEKNFVPLATIVALPLMAALSGMPQRWKAWLAVPFLLVVFIQFRGISFASRAAGERMHRIAGLVDIMAKEHLNKAVLTNEQLDAAGLHIHWALPYETLLLSTVDPPHVGRTAMAVRELGTTPIPQGLNFHAWNDDLPASALDPRHFFIPDTPYVVLSGPIHLEP
jgi:hypothetical protein